MADPLRSLVERLLPWWDARQEVRRNDRTEAIRQRSIRSRVRAEKIIAEYETASTAAGIAGRALVKEARRPTDDT